MKLTDWQMDALVKGQMPQFARRVVDFMRRVYARQVTALDDATLLQQVTTALERARRYGFTQQDSLATFAAISILCDRDFDRYPPVHTILRKTRIPDHRRLDLLERRLTPAVWRQVRRHGQASRQSAGRA